MEERTTTTNDFCEHWYYSQASYKGDHELLGYTMAWEIINLLTVFTDVEAKPCYTDGSRQHVASAETASEPQPPSATHGQLLLGRNQIGGLA